MRLSCKWAIQWAKLARAKTPAHDCIGRARIAIVRPAEAGRTPICRFGGPDRRTCFPEPDFSFSAPNTQAGRSDPTAWPDCSGLRRFGNVAWETSDFAPFLPDRRSQLRTAERMGSHAGHGRMRVDQYRDDRRSRILRTAWRMTS